jgi:hypothetical protein
MRILVCGMPRSMTTWAFNVLRELVVSPPAQAIWIEPGSADERAFASAPGVVLGKCHHFSPLLAEAADFVVYSYRDLRTAAVSAYRKFGSSGSREQLDVWLETERLWMGYADVVLRYEDVERDPTPGAAELATALRRRASGEVQVSTDPPERILQRVEESFQRHEASTGPTYDAATLILPGHRTFQPAFEALPETEKAIHSRVETEFQAWLQSHGYAGDTSARPDRAAHGELAQPADLGPYIAALMREAVSKEAAIAGLGTRSLHERVEEAEAERVRLMNDLEERKREMLDKQRVITEQEKALQAYRATFAVLGFVIVPLNHFVLGVRSVFRRTVGKLAPRLGVLHQHPPIELRRPADYTALPQPAPRISLVTPSFRQAPFIERTIRSVIEQGYPDLEYFVQDGGSRDGTVEILERRADRLTGWDSQADTGQSQAINRAFAKTSGEIMAWLNSDDILFPGALCYVADFFAKHPDVDVVYGHRVLIDEEDREIGRWILPPHNDEVLSWADYVPQETLFWRRRIWDKAGGQIDESFRFAMDWDLLLRFRAAGARFERLPRFLGGFRVHAQQKTSAGINEIGFAEMDRLRERALGRVPSRAEITRAVARYLMRHTASDLRWRIRDRLGMQA